MEWIRSRRPSPGLVISCIALFVALGGVSYGLARNSVDSREIKNNTVSSKDLKNNSARGKDVKNNSLTGKDVKESSLGKVPSAAAADSAANAASLGGTPASGYIKGTGLVVGNRLDMASNEPDRTVLEIPGLARFTLTCTEATSLELKVVNIGTGDLLVHFDVGSPQGFATTLAPGASGGPGPFTPTEDVAADVYTFNLSSGSVEATATISAARSIILDNPDICRAIATAVVTS